MVWRKIDSGLGGLWVRLLIVVLWVKDWVADKAQSRPSPLKGFSVTTKGT